MQRVNWTWSVRSRDGAMNGMEFALCTTAGGLSRVLIHATPDRAFVEVRGDDDHLIARGDIDREGEYSPMTLVEVGEDELRRREVWPDEELYGLPVLLSGGEVGLLREWEHDQEHTWWRWSIEFSNHTGRPADWAPPAQSASR